MYYMYLPMHNRLKVFGFVTDNTTIAVEEGRKRYVVGLSQFYSSLFLIN